MDCRRTLWLGLGFLAAAAGCQHDFRMNPVAPTPQVQTSAPAPAEVQAVPPNAVVRRESDLPKKTPHASTCVAAGDCLAQQALAPDIGETAKTDCQERARKAYQQALSIDPHCLPAYQALAALYVAMKDHAHAVATYQKAAQKFPNAPSVFYELGMCHGGEKEWDQAIRNLARAAELDPENRKIVDALGWMQARAGRYDDSLATFMKVHDEPEAHYKLAWMLQYLNEIDLCKQHLRAALDKEPGMQKAQALLAQLNARPGAAVQPTSYTEPAVPAAPVAAPTPPDDPAPAVKGVLLPAPPRFPIRYENTAPLPESGDGAAPSGE